MRRIYALFLFLAAAGGIKTAYAQNDSARLDAGYTSLNRNLTQTITIKGSDLEKMPFANLSDAIAAWSYGAYTRPSTLLYIVDGSPVADVNAYSVFDIEEVVLVENAAAEVYTAAGQQEVVLIRTRRGKEKPGLTAAAQTGLVTGGNNRMSTDMRWYQQYYLGANTQAGTWRFGASANWLRDAAPLSASYHVVTPDNLQRWRFHGYIDWQPDKHEQVELAAAYVPERFGLGTDSAEQRDYTYGVRNSATQHFFLPELRWHGQWLGGLTNQLQASYVQSVYQASDIVKTTLDTSSSYYDVSLADIDRSSYHVYIRDRLAYDLRAGGWRIEPAMNVSYEHVTERLSYTQNENGAYWPGNVYNTGASGIGWDKYHVLFYTPQLDIHYKKAFDLTGGEMTLGGFKAFPGTLKAFSFISGSIDVLRLADENSSSGLAFFGSYAQRAAAPLQGYQMSDLTYGYSQYNPYFGSGISATYSLYYNPFSGSGPILSSFNNLYYYPGLPNQRLWAWDAGVRYSGWKGRLQIQGNLERRNYALLEYVYVPVGSNFTSPGETGLIANEVLLHLDVRATIIQGTATGWESGINGTVLHSRVNGASTETQVGQFMGYAGDQYPNPFSVTGGWVNRFRVRHFIGGLDLLYHFGGTSFKTPPGVLQVVTGKINGVAVPNIYAGYQLDPAHKGPEIFVGSRGLFRSDPSDLSDGRRYYTIGGKLSL